MNDIDITQSTTFREAQHVLHPAMGRRSPYFLAKFATSPVFLLFQIILLNLLFENKITQSDTHETAHF